MSKKILFNDGWIFTKQKLNTNLEDIKNKSVLWENIEIPHDWLIYDTKNLYEDGVGWYKKTFQYRSIDNERAAIRFEGVYMDTTIYVNDKIAGIWKYGYTTFEFDITSFLIQGDNEIIVKVVHQSPNSRWYSGAGIYRNVWFKIMSSLHIISDGVYISTVKDKDYWYADIETEIDYSFFKKDVHDIDVKHTVLQNGKIITTSNKKAECKDKKLLIDSQSIHVSNPSLWDIENPSLYTLKTELILDGKIIDEELQNFGFRTIQFDSNTGFLLNGRKVKLNGVCLHHDLGCLGAAVNKAALTRQIDIMKKMGVNAIRTSHNIPAVELMDIADEHGILIVSESFDMWERSKTEYDYARFFKDWHELDVASWVRRDRNRPSVIMWSIGNEISDTHTGERGQEITKKLMELVVKHDPKKNASVTIGSNYIPWENAQKCADIVKLAGYNYAEKYYEEHHKAHPDWIIYGSETSSIVQSRGIYHFPASKPLLSDDDFQCSSMGNSATSWGAKSIETCITDDRNAYFSAGQFLWSGIDYIGEPTPYHTKNSYFGQADTCCFPKDSYYIYQAEWTDYKKNPMVHIFPYWDFNEGQQIDICVCSNAPKVELFFNDNSLGTFVIDHKTGKNLIGKWQLPYKKGTLKVLAYDENGSVIAQDKKSSFGDASRIDLTPDKFEMNADGRDLIFIEISMIDENENPVENANNRVDISVKGAGRLVGLDNGDSTDYDQYKGTSRRLFSGKMLAVIAAALEPGEIKIEAASYGLKTQTLYLTSLPCSKPEGISIFMENHKSETIIEIPVRKIELITSNGNKFDKDNKVITITVKLLPENATYQDVEWRITNDAGIDSNIALVKPNVNKAEVTALADGKFRLRCSSRNGSYGIRLISSLEFEVNGVGTYYLNPYQFVSAGLYNVSNCELGNGNDRGIATPGESIAYVGFKGTDFGDYGSDELTIPIFVLDNDEFLFEIWEGMPGEEESSMVAKYVYDKPSIWNTYQEVTVKLSKRLKGITALCFVTYRKAHIKGFIFKKIQKAYQKLFATECTRIYGDSFTKTNDVIENIGNNVTLEYNDMDFGNDGFTKIVICGRSPIEKNMIHIRFTGSNGEDLRVIEFLYTEDYAEKEFFIKGVFGLQKVNFIFLPGSRFDLKWFRFIK